MLIGAHESIAGGLDKAVARGEEDCCEVIQIFTGPPSRWRVAPVTEEAAGLFRRRIEESSISSVLVHGSYLINPAGPDEALWQRSLRALEEEYQRCLAIGAGGLVIHPGSTRGAKRRQGIERAARMVAGVLERFSNGPHILLENTAGSGHNLGASFADIVEIIDLAGGGERMGCCFDTAHAFAAGYDLRDPDSLADSLGRIDSQMGLTLIKAVHLNDSARELGSGVDRHARIGEGLLGKKAFSLLLARREFRRLPAVLETAPLPDDEGRYRPQVDLLLRLREAAS